MKSKTVAFALLASLFLSLTSVPIFAHGGEDHSPKKSAGPNGGRVLNGIDPRAEFFVTSDRKVQITFLDDHGQAVAPAGQTVVVTSGKRSAPTSLNFAPVGNVLLSDDAIPAGNRVPTVVQITPSNAKTVTSKFNVNLSTCSGCQLVEYACICEGH